MENNESTPILGVRIDVIDRDTLRETIRTALREGAFLHVVTINPEMLVESARNADFKRVLNASGLNVIDGFGIRLLAWLLYGVNIPRITGVEIAEMVCQVAADEGKSVFFLGGRNVGTYAAAAMQSQYPALKIAGTFDGDPTTFDEVRKTNPDAVLVAFGAPAQEQWISTYGQKIDSLRVAVGVGGTFDFWAGVVRRAPKIMRKMGMEWLWRLMRQPSRMGRIYNAVMVFPFLCIQEEVFGKKF